VYEVLLRWTGSNNRATNTPVAIQTRTNSTPVLRLVNQQINGTRWNSLGFFDLDPDTARVVVANSNTTLYVIADAVQFLDPTQLPAVADRDGDRLPDWWERWYFLSETKAEPDADADGDGMTNYQEYLTATDPLNPASRFNMRAVLDAMPPQMQLSWPSATNRTYRIEVSEDLKTFSLYQQGIPATPPVNLTTVSMAGNPRFFRVVAE
jgi:hypothetical protein